MPSGSAILGPAIAIKLIATISLCALTTLTPRSLEAGASLVDFELIDTRFASGIWSVAYNEFDHRVYITTRSNRSGAVYRIESDNSATLLYSGSAPAGLEANPDNGDVFFSQDFPGYLLRLPAGNSPASIWVNGIPGGGDDEPAGILIVPDYYTGDLASPGDGFFTGRGFGGSERVLSFSPDTPEGEVLLYSFYRDDGLFGIIATDESIWLIERELGISELTENQGVYSSTPLTTSEPISNIEAAVWDNHRKLAYLALSDFTTPRVARVVAFDPATGSITTVISGLSELRWSSLAVDATYSRLFVGDYGQNALFTYELPTPSQADLREPFYDSGFEAFFGENRTYDGETRRFGGTLTVPGGSGESVAIDFAVSPHPEFVAGAMGTKLNLGSGLDVSETQVSLQLTPQSRPLYNLTIFYEDFDIGQSFDFPGQFPDHYPGLSRSGNLLQTNADDMAGTFTFRELSADTALEILFNRNGSDVRITKIGFELLKPAYDGSPYAWEGNTGWINFDASTRSLAVKSSFSLLEGYAYSANTGWIFFGNGSPANALAYANDESEHGVNISSGNLTGYAWSANTGWIHFGWAAGSDPNRAQINLSTGELSGYAWGGNLGWINLNDVEIPDYFAPNSADPLLVDFGANFEANDLDDFRSDLDDGIRDFAASIDTDIGQSDALHFDLNISGSFEVSGTGDARVVDIGIGSAGESVITFTSQDAKLYNLTFTFESFDIGEEFEFGTLAPDKHPSLQLNAGTLTTPVDDVACSFTFDEFAANTQLQFTVRHNGSGVRLTKIDFDASDSTLSDAPDAYSGNTGWVNLAPNTNTGVVVHETYLSGYAFDTNTGWIKFGQRLPANGYRYTNTGTDHGVNHDNGALYGYAWSGNAGWVYFGWAPGNDPNAPRIDLQNGNFSGYAWGANIGWINLGSGQLTTDELRIDDIDLDGMADSWELENFGDLSTAGVGTDQDGDRETDAAEYVGGTDASNASSFLRIIATSYNGDFTEITIEFTSDPSRVYTIDQATDLTAVNPWSDSGLGEITGETGSTTRSFTYPGNDKRFFRVSAKIPLSN